MLKQLPYFRTSFKKSPDTASVTIK